jgi:hypothetical protein
MKRYAQIFKNSTFPLMTLLALLALALGFYLFHVRNREAYFTHRYLRLLAFASGQIEERLDTIESVFANYQKDETLSAKDLDNLPADLRALPSIEKVDAPPSDFAVACTGVTLEGRIEGDRFWVYAGWRETSKKAKDGRKCGKAKENEIALFRFDPFTLAQYDQRKGFEGFETFLVASRDGTVVFQKNQRGSREVNIVSLKGLVTSEGKAVDLLAAARTTSNVEVTLGGESYRLFLRPCCRTIWTADREPPPAKEGDRSKIPASKEAAAAGNSLELVVGGAVRTSTLSAQTWSISFTLGLAVVSLLALALLGLSFLRVLAIGPQEKLRVADALWVGFSAVVGVGLLTLLLVDLHAYRSLITGTDENLEKLAGEIKHNMKEELKVAWTQLGDFNRQAMEELKGDRKEVPVAATCGDLRKAGLPPREIKTPGFYLDFERFAWADSKGQQCFKWSIDKAKDPLVRNIRQRRYFREASRGRAAIEPVFSVATGRWVVALARPVKLAKTFVGVLGVEMSSLNRPVLPPGYGFAVVDENGGVLFHSEQGRAGYENFFDETDNDRGLHALVFARRSGSQDAEYLGRGHRLFVTPIQPPAPSAEEPIRTPPFWTLIVFSDKADMRSFNVDTMSTATLLLVLYLFVYMAGCLLVRAVRRHYRAGWLWPEKKGEMREKSHLALTAFYGLCVMAFIAAFRQLDGIDLLWFAFAFPWAVLLVSYRLCTPGMSKRRQTILGASLAGVLLLIHLTPGDGGAFDLLSLLRGGPGFLAGVSLGLWVCFFAVPWVQRLRLCPPRRIYLAAASLLLAVTAAGPAVAFFCVAHRAHLETRIKRAQLELARDREARDRRFDWRYNQLKDRGASEGPLLQQKVEDRRNTHWDLYHCFYFGTRFQDPCPSSPPSLARPETQLAKAEMTPGAAGEGRDAGEKLCTLLPGFIQQVLPLYTEDFIRVRWLMADSDRDERGGVAWAWNHTADGELRFQLNGLRLTSVIPPVSLAGLRPLWPFSLLLLTLTVVGVARFVAERCLLFGLPTPEAGEPMSMASASTQNFILVSPHIDDMAERLAAQNAAVIDLRQLTSREDLLRCLGRADLVGSPRICLHHFEHRLQEEEHNLLKLELMEELILGRDKPVIVLGHVVPAWYLLDRQPVTMSGGGSEKASKEIQERWRHLLRRFMTWVCRKQADVDRLNSDLGAIEERVLSDGTANGRRLKRLLAAAREECGESEQLERLAGDMVRARLQDLSPDLFFDDLRERAEPYYRALWTMCTEAEKVVLVHLAEGGLVNGKNADALKMLMRRGLVKRDPCFRLMNESFRRFVGTDVCLGEVRSLERQAAASAWNRIRTPFMVSLIGVCAFFFITQREVFDVSMAFFSAVAASLPALFRVFSAAAPGQSKPAG